MIKKLGTILGIVSGLTSIILWVIFVFSNPYAAPSNGPMMVTFFMLFLPACLVLYASLKSKLVLLLIACIWSLPVSLYVYFTPGIFSWFGITSLAYLFSFVLSFVTQKIIEIKNIRQNYLTNSNTD
ncbi:MAG TPA: hypothetical protein VNR38_15475 [Ureibacillus sp.]|nr:hypothetical protein [Ureibacillus sp.]